jgi:hypothetical protein
MVEALRHNGEVSEFLRGKRAALTPEAAGLEMVGQRRVTGLRREELALLAGVSVDYYTRPEQGSTSCLTGHAGRYLIGAPAGCGRA